MSVTDNNTNGMVMPVAPMYGNGGNIGGFGFGNDGGLFWLLVLFLFGFAGNGWGGGFGGNTQADVQRGFDQQSVMTGINGINNAVNTGFGNVQTALCNGFAQAEIAANARQMADMNQAFAAQTAMSQGFNSLGSQFASCCCENRLASANLQNVIQTENCADRAAISDGIRDLLTNQNANTQRILDQMCQDRIQMYQNKVDEKNEEIANLRTQLNMMNLAATQNAQTATIQAGQRALASEVEQYINPTPIPAYTVQNPACCNQGFGCGCN